jgi:uncharacterized protein
MVDPRIIESVRNYLRRVSEEYLPVAFGAVFGSYARGCAGKWSDIDLVVVSAVFDGHKGIEDVLKLWTATVRTDNRIEPIPCGERQWREDDSSPVIEMARREGVIVYPEVEKVRQAG